MNVQSEPTSLLITPTTPKPSNCPSLQFQTPHSTIGEGDSTHSTKPKMKWGSRKNSPSSSKAATGGGNGGISSWISKIKQISGNSKSPPPAKTKQKIKVNASPPLYADDEEEEEEAYWRLSFGKESLEGGKKSTTTTTKSTVLGFNSGEGEGDDDQLHQIRVSDHRNCKSFTTTTQSFTNMVSNVRKTKDREEILLETPRRRIQKGRKVIIRKSRRTDRRNFEYSDSGRDDSIQVNLEPIKTIKNQNCNAGRKSHYISSSNSMELRGRSIDDLDRKIWIKTEKQRNSVDQKRSTVKIYSPRTPSKVEIRAIEEIKKSKLKKKKEEMKEMEGRRRRGLESCAMVKCSYDPQNDFRESMVDMILEKNIRRSEELEELLACYLTLNSDEYHDLIIKVFKQVWFDLNRFSFSPELENQDYSYSDF